MPWGMLRGLSGWSSNTNYIEHPADVLVNDLPVVTLAAWARYSSTAASQVLSTKRTTSPATASVQWAVLTTPSLQIFRHRATTNLQFVAALSNWGFAATNTWLFFVVTMDINNAALCRHFLGSETIPAVEATTYSTATLGAGAVLTENGVNIRIGDNGPTGGLSWSDRIATYDVYNRALSLNQIRELQATGGIRDARPIISSRYWGTTQKQVDRSGLQLHGTVTGTLTENLGPVPRLPWSVALQDPVMAPVVAAGVTYPQLERLTRGLHRGMPGRAA